MPSPVFQIPLEEESRVSIPRTRRVGMVLGLLVALGIIIGLATVEQLSQPPVVFPINTDIAIVPGSTVSSVADQFAAAGFVRSALYFYVTLQTTFESESVKAGVYRFEEPKTPLELAHAITQGTNIAPHESVTFPEGFRVSRMNEYLPESFSTVDPSIYEEREGYLFPDTYFIDSDATLQDIITLMEKNFAVKVIPLFEAYPNHPLSDAETIILASIVEREANDEESMRTVAGILMNRLKIGMALQVDATLNYLFGKESSELTEEDLEYDSPYNTYRYPGLPPAPIANPGIAAISAVLSPIPSDYLYYLTGNDGTFYYAKDFEAHKRNKARYLR